MNKFEYKNLTPFKWFVLENFPFIEADFDALTDWQLYCKLGKEINKIIDSQNTVGSEMEKFTQAFIELQNYVDNYFKNLDVQDEINNKLNEMAEDGELENIISNYLKSINNCYLAPLSVPDAYKENENNCYLGISFDGQCFTPIPSTKNFCEKNTDIHLFKYKDYYLFACTTSATTENPNLDFYAGWTKDFKNFHFSNVSLGFSQYRNTHFPEASEDKRRWTPRFYLDKENNLNVLISMATNNITELDAYNFQKRTKMGIFHQTVKFNENDTNFLTGDGDIDIFKINENSESIDTFFDGDIIYKDNVYYLLYKNGHYNDVCISISTTDDYSIFNTIKVNIFENPYTEAPAVVKANDGFYIYGQQYIMEGLNNIGRNLLLFTKDFNNFISIGYPKKFNNDIYKVGFMRNLSPILLDDKSLVTFFKTQLDSIGYGLDYPITQYGTNYLKIIKKANENNRICSIFDNSKIAINENIDEVIINNLWNAKNITFFGTLDNMKPYFIRLKYKKVYERIVMSGDYPTSSVYLTDKIIRSNNRSFIPTSFYIINKSQDYENLSIETRILPNNNFASCHIFNSSNNHWEANETICNIGVRNHQNNMYIYATVRNNNDESHPFGSIISLIVNNNGDVYSPIKTPNASWSTDFVFLLPTGFYNDL